MQSLKKISDQKLAPQLDQDLSLQPAASEPGLTPAAVLITLHEEDGEDWLLFTKRTENLRHHKGQISFPGGKFDPEDDNLAITALRETREELGICESDVQLLGSLPPFATITHYLVYPFVGRFDWPYELDPNPGEIAEVIRVPLSHLRNPRHQRQETRPYRGADYRIYYFDYPPHTIWGITGQILHSFLEKL